MNFPGPPELRYTASGSGNRPDSKLEVFRRNNPQASRVCRSRHERPDQAESAHLGAVQCPRSSTQADARWQVESSFFPSSLAPMQSMKESHWPSSRAPTYTNNCSPRFSFCRLLRRRILELLTGICLLYCLIHHIYSGRRSYACPGSRRQPTFRNQLHGALNRNMRNPGVLVHPAVAVQRFFFLITNGSYLIAFVSF